MLNFKIPIVFFFFFSEITDKNIKYVFIHSNNFYECTLPPGPNIRTRNLNSCCTQLNARFQENAMIIICNTRISLF